MYKRYDLVLRTIPLPNITDTYVSIKRAKEIVYAHKLLTNLKRNLDTKIISKNKYDYIFALTHAIYKLDRNLLYRYFIANQYVQTRVYRISMDTYPTFPKISILARYFRIKLKGMFTWNQLHQNR